MTSTLPGEQVEHAFKPARLGNWEVPDTFERSLQKTLGHSRFGTMRPRSNTTTPIADDRGYLLPGVSKIKNAFQPAQTYHTTPRWPTANVTHVQSPAATMGYKGRTTDFLPSTTVHIRAAEVPGSREFNYSGV